MTGAPRIDAVLIGKAAPFRGTEQSAIRKAAVGDPVQVTQLGLVGDEQADLTVHGGSDKAIHHYPFEHYTLWQASAPAHPKLNTPGAFGENISTIGATEESVCIGDRYRMGTALVEVSQPRQPCWKQAHVMDWPTLPKMMVREAKSGWYYRVIEQGVVAEGDTWQLVSRPHCEWTVAHVFRLLMHKQSSRDATALRALSALDVLESGWREMAAESLGR